MGANPSIVLEKEIGRGTYGVVHQGTYQNKPVAIKKFHQVLLEQNKRGNYDHVQQEFTKECKLLTSLSHPHIVRVIGVFTVKEENMLVMELLHETLRDYLGRTKEKGYVMTIHGAVKMSCEIVAGLSYLHSLNPPLVHRHLNGRNVLLTEKGLVKISDSGLATFCPIDVDYLKSMSPECIAYVAPEVLIGENPPQFTDKVDMFSVGVLMLQIVTCLDPNPTLQGIGTIPETERRNSHLKLVPESHPLRIPIVSCLDNDPQKRFSSKSKVFDQKIVLNFKSISPGLLKQLKEEGNWTVSEQVLLKVAVVSGFTGNGRQAFIRRYVRDEYVDYSTPEMGHTWHWKDLLGPENVSLRLQIWSMKIWSSYLSLSFSMIHNYGMNGCLLIFHLWDRSSLYQHAVKLLTEWRNFLGPQPADKEDGPGPAKIPIPIILVGTKCDVEDRRQVTREEMEAFVEEHDLAGCIEVSAKTGYNVDEAMNVLLYHMLIPRTAQEELECCKKVHLD